jgi:uncharacterized cupredoxin-like copper-binding protein
MTGRRPPHGIEFLVSAPTGSAQDFVRQMRRSFMQPGKQCAAAFAIALACSPAAAVRADPVDPAQAQTVTVVTVEYAFEPNRLDFRRDVAYRLHLVNRGNELHEFTAPAFFQAVEIADPAVLNPEHTEIVVRPGEAKDLYFVPRRPGRFPLTCADHDWAGMTGDITIE